MVFLTAWNASMRVADTFTESLFTEERLKNFIPQSHPLGPIRKTVNEALSYFEDFLSGRYSTLFQAGRPAIAREKLPRARIVVS